MPVVHLDLRISPRIFEKILNDPQGLGGKKSLDIILLKSSEEYILGSTPFFRHLERESIDVSDTKKE
jgi:hypothetical protein